MRCIIAAVLLCAAISFAQTADTAQALTNSFFQTVITKDNQSHPMVVRTKGELFQYIDQLAKGALDGREFRNLMAFELNSLARKNPNALEVPLKYYNNLSEKLAVAILANYGKTAGAVHLSPKVKKGSSAVHNTEAARDYSKVNNLAELISPLTKSSSEYERKTVLVFVQSLKNLEENYQKDIISLDRFKKTVLYTIKSEFAENDRLFSISSEAMSEQVRGYIQQKYEQETIVVDHDAAVKEEKNAAEDKGGESKTENAETDTSSDDAKDTDAKEPKETVEEPDAGDTPTDDAAVKEEKNAAEDKDTEDGGESIAPLIDRSEDDGDIEEKVDKAENGAGSEETADPAEENENPSPQEPESDPVAGEPVTEEELISIFRQEQKVINKDALEYFEENSTFDHYEIPQTELQLKYFYQVDNIKDEMIFFSGVVTDPAGNIHQIIRWGLDKEGRTWDRND